MRAAFAAGLALAVAGAGPAPECGHDHSHDHGSGHGGERRSATDRHPDPRPGITAERVVQADRIRGRSAARAYDLARELPHVLDGIRCHCDCHERDGLRSLLSCFENMMAATCSMCRAQVELAHELSTAGRSLDEIRSAIDDRFGF